MNEMDVINAYVRELKLATFRENAEPYAQDAVREQWGCLGYLRRLLEEEVTRRREKSKITRIHKAGFPQMKYLEELERNELPIEGQAMLPILETLDFINEGRNAVMYGNPGTGKTHMAIALGVKACLEGYTVFFTSIPRLLTQIREAKTGRTLRNLEVKFERFDLVICDELGYVGFDKEGAEMLFNHLSLKTAVWSRCCAGITACCGLLLCKIAVGNLFDTAIRDVADRGKDHLVCSVRTVYKSVQGLAVVAHQVALTA